ncbi:MAG: restriction endonuclease subunit S [Negativicutes bacterium]|nr:restriction endonuclease subunit S [Negativicutes bacterium]
MNKEKTKMFPKLRFPEFKNIGAINLENGNYIFEAISNKNHNSDLPVLAITQEHGAIPRDQIDYNVSVTDKSIESYKVVEKGDFIISLRSFQGGIEYSLYHGICSPAYIILRKKIDVVEQYYKYYFKTSRFIQDLNRDLEGIRDGKMVSYSQFSDILLPKPDNKEQRKIADCLSFLDDLIAAEDKKLSALRAHKKGLMQKLFPAEGKTLPECRFPEFRDNGEWEERKLSQVTSYVDYRGKTPEKSSSGIFLLTAKNIKTGYLDYLCSQEYIPENTYNEVMSRGVPQIGDVLITTEAPCGNVAQIDNENVALAQRIIKYRGVEGELDNTYLKYVFLSPKFQYNLSSKSTGGIVKGIRGSVLHELAIDFTSLNEQQKIADCLSSLDALITAQAEKIEALKAHKKGLMQGLFPSIEEVGE